MALSGFVRQFETQFASMAYQLSEAEKEREYHTVTGTVGVWNSPNGTQHCVKQPLFRDYPVEQVRRPFNDDDRLTAFDPGQPG